MECTAFGFLRVCCLPSWEDTVRTELDALFPWEYVPAEWVGAWCCFTIMIRPPDERLQQALAALEHTSGGQIRSVWTPFGAEGR